MINVVTIAIEEAKEKIQNLLKYEYYGEVPCKYMQSGKEISGLIILYSDSAGNDIYEQLRPDVRVRSHTGKEYFVLLTNIISVDSLSEL